MHQEKKANDNKDINLESNNIADVSGTNLITLQTIYRTMQNNNASLLASQLYLYTAENAVSPDCLSLYVDANAPADLQKNVKQFCSLNFTNLTIQFEKEKLGITLSEKDAHTKQEKIAAVSGHAGLKPLLEKISSYNIVEIKDNA